jgi:hypothetical protein
MRFAQPIITEYMEKDTILAVFGAAVGLAGIVLVFIGFVSAHGEGFQNNDRKKIFKRVAKIGLIPFAIALIAASFSLCWLETCSPSSYYYALLSFKVVLASTLLYGIISVTLFL